MNVKTGIVILAVLALCFFAGVGNGLLRTNDSSPGDPPSWSEKLDDLFRVRATVDDVLSSSNDNVCLDRGAGRLTVPTGSPCTYTLSTAFLPRSLKLTTSGPASVKIIQPVREDGTTDITDDATLVGTGTFRISSRQSKTDRIELTITCLDLTTSCVLLIL